MLSLFMILSYILFIAYAEEDCKRNFSVRRNSIILTKSSQSKGANFIHKQVVGRFADCYSLCCSNAECTVAVYENKVNHICFMFDCKRPNVCLFTEHEDYTSMLLIPEQDHAVSKLPIKQSKTRSKSLVRPSMDAALGETCGVMRKCGPANSMCTSGTCICQLGFIGRMGMCVRSLCPKPELMFQCMDVSKSPFCIALYDQCNGISECGDSSDEVNCEPSQSGRHIFNETSNSREEVADVKTKPVFRQPVSRMQSTANYQRNHFKKYPDSRKQNTSHHYQTPYKNKYRKKNPLAENQLLLLEAKNKPPKSRQHNVNERPKHRPQQQQYEKGQIPSENNSPYEKQTYSKSRMPPYPRVSKADEYYQKGSPEPSDSSSRWNSADSSSNDYEYPQISSNNRDSSSDWDPDQYSEPSYAESPAKYSSDRNNYVYYPEYEEEAYTKPRGRYISDSDRYRPKYSSKYGHEQSMNSDHRRKDLAKNNPRVLYANLPKKIDAATDVSSQRQSNEMITEDSGAKNLNEWNTAVIALSLGLLVSAALLVALGLKMRTWRRRMRGGKKGKSLTTDEGDYLINGMYL